MKAPEAWIGFDKEPSGILLPTAMPCSAGENRAPGRIDLVSSPRGCRGE
ncbi:MAG: hypothetical protein MZV63_11545 [Marinilabiliales bacterium]|nr:hypothetical protein [Marinilabiliales bacterium]